MANGQTVEITRDLAAKIVPLVDAGLRAGLGQPRPGEMCAEAAVCYALGLPHGDDPQCVAAALRDLVIALNDKDWSSNAARAKGMKRLIIAQLGTRGPGFDRALFAAKLAEMTIRSIVPIALRAAASMSGLEKYKQSLEDAAASCEKEGTRDAALAAAAAAAAAGKHDEVLATFAEKVVGILVEMETPGAAYLDLAPLAA